jgi:hypothetical protein
MSKSRELRNKRIALEAIDMLTKCAEGVAVGGVALEEFHRRWESRGVNWTRPGMLALDLDAWVTANEAAEQFDVTPEMIRRWHYRGHISSLDNRYNVGEIAAYIAKQKH